MQGVFGLGSHTDLYKKLEWEYAQLIEQPHNGYLAYNFFVTAWHLLDWKYPNESDSSIRDEIRDRTPLLQICEFVAKGAKHFEPRAKQLNAASDSQRGNMWKTGVWAPGFWEDGSLETWLVVPLSGDAQKIYGDAIKVGDLARLVMEYWNLSI